MLCVETAWHPRTRVPVTRLYPHTPAGGAAVWRGAGGGRRGGRGGVLQDLPRVQGKYSVSTGISTGTGSIQAVHGTSRE